ncbi:hypothetical protein G4V39_06310 [Thermosulfuriphilus ammonigenes]|uniref:Uncharacterized protein n=1 Tax=Thermosulfuriphilus ammonigenes TaxID=1936021 RepID=A0A6G7PW38_9BACT|nr:hypothetical protein [Thermosulfuriphilus ammonigenes]MBA2847906.1 hypothetical protein [Thermosulfuriphilus ammonigenes]QIJ71899.1 hypothetical protein G4V39_06310 [Thermosulfuriphilus ammonigenes]
MKKEEKNKNSVEMGFCQKFSEEIPLNEGCRHPKDYCPHRQACMLYFLFKEKKKGAL